jgi:CheY-like chemotaxis protein
VTAARRPILALVDDLIMASRVESGSRAAGYPVVLPRSADEFRQVARARPALVLVGVSATRQPWQTLVGELKADPNLAGIPVLAFGSHLDLALRERALAAGCDRMVANSQVALAFPALLQQLGLDVDAPATQPE